MDLISVEKEEFYVLKKVWKWSLGYRHHNHLWSPPHIYSFLSNKRKMIARVLIFMRVCNVLPLAYTKTHAISNIICQQPRCLSVAQDCHCYQQHHLLTTKVLLCCSRLSLLPATPTKAHWWSWPCRKLGYQPIIQLDLTTCTIHR